MHIESKNIKNPLNWVVKYVYVYSMCPVKSGFLFIDLDGESSNGRTADFDSVSLGSNPSSPGYQLININ